MTAWPRTDANLILVFEILLMSAFLIMNATDALLFANSADHYTVSFSDPVSQYFQFLFNGMENSTLILVERFAWWFHILGILVFLNYLFYSKHLHILLAFPNTFFANLNVKGQFNNLESVTKEVKLMMDPDADPYAAPLEGAEEKFGASDVFDLNWVQLMNAYSCTECGKVYR